MSTGQAIKLQREVMAVQIPSGERVALPAGTDVIITQALGGTFTVGCLDQPGLFRISGEDGSALGVDAAVRGGAADDGLFTEEKLWAQLRNCYDPEIPVNIVDLGLIYSLDVEDDQASGEKDIVVKMTLTAPGCGMGPSLAADAEQRMMSVPGVRSAHVELVWDPPWSPERISAAGREKLGMV